ncbi:MAG: aquaporin [Bacteroides sp.]|nr:aquaporin [Bacteroides sp.]MCM1412796.1 aquaporin [Bacteroides sp.]MCM1470910.1 aquaporin [Bacteroides sp.]
MKKYLAELFGTMFLVLLACGSAVLGAGTNGSIGVLGVGICFGLVLICLCYAIGSVSGCHVNPAVSFAMLISGKMSCKDFCGYVVAQLIGAAIGGGLLFWLTQSAPDFAFGGITKIDGTVTGTLAANTLQSGASPVLAMIAEVLLTMFFVFVILCATDEKKGAGNFAGIAIGIALGLVNIVGIGVDNCSVNPARSFGPALFSEGAGAWGDFWIMVAGPLAGAALAVVLYRLCVNCCCKKSCEA